MRQLGTLADQLQAQRVTAYLITLGVDTQLEPADGQWAVWVRDEDALTQARQEFARFLQDPAHVRYQGLEKQADDVIRQEQARREAARRNVVEMRGRWKGGAAAISRPAPLTFGLIGVCVVIALLTNFGRPPRGAQAAGGAKLLQKLMFVETAEYIETGDAWYDIKRGEVWRLLTPMLLHLSITHLAFNMLWLYQLGRLLETRLGLAYYLGLILAFDLAAVLLSVLTPESLRELLGAGPLMGGMSGVVYGLFGFIWMQSRHNPAFGVRLSEFTVYLMLGWLVFCFLPISGLRVANMAHLGGLVSGIVAGLWYARH